MWCVHWKGQNMKVLFAASEAVPFIKTGGLADVAGSLPKALKKQGVEVSVVLPKYGNIPEEYRHQMKHLFSTEINVSWRREFLGVDTYELDGVTYYFIDNEKYFKREGLYGYGDDAERFSFFCRAVLELFPQLGYWPDIIHANDWQTALISVMLKLEHMEDDRYRNIKTILTIHNLKYQGIFPKDVMGDVLGFDWKYFNNGDLEFYDAVNFMKAGIIYSDYVTTVSESYAQEIQYPYYGEKLDGLLRSKKDSLYGIVNGIDYDVYNPATDKHIFEKYDVNSLDKKLDNKLALQKELGLPENRSAIMIGMVTRLVEAKGLELVVRIMDEFLQHEDDVQFVLLGTGDKKYEDWFKGLQWRFPTKVSANIYFSNQLAQKIYAASSLFLMPSDYEPCGIGQLIAMRYGAAPIVRETGGLKDTVHQYNKDTETGNGYVFPNFNAHELLFKMKEAVANTREVSTALQVTRNAMNCDYSWNDSARKYKELYQQLNGK